MKPEEIMEKIQAILDDEAKARQCAALSDKEAIKAFFKENGVEIVDDAAQGVLDALKGEMKEDLDEEALEQVSGGVVLTLGTVAAVAGIGAVGIGACYVGGYLIGRYLKN